MNGILVVHKEKGYTSRDVVNVVSKILQTKKVGHTGTLDPLATGVLVLCVGNYTKFVSKLTNHEKEYVAKIRFGVETDTLDITGKIIKQNSVYPTKESFENILFSFLGRQKQTVPIYSAKKVNGKKLYEYARSGEKVLLPEQEIEIFSIELMDFQKEFAVIRCHVSKGTYIRSLIHDICTSLNVLGTMEELTRTKLGEFSLTSAFFLEDIKNKNISLLTFHAFLKYERQEITEHQKYLVEHGNELYFELQTPYLLLTYQKEEIALYEKKENRYVPILNLTK